MLEKACRAGLTPVGKALFLSTQRGRARWNLSEGVKRGGGVKMEMDGGDGAVGRR